MSNATTSRLFSVHLYTALTTSNGRRRDSHVDCVVVAASSDEAIAKATAYVERRERIVINGTDTGPRQAVRSGVEHGCWERDGDVVALNV